MSCDKIHPFTLTSGTPIVPLECPRASLPLKISSLLSQTPQTKPSGLNKACRILVPQPGMNPHPLQWKLRVLTTGSTGKSTTSTNTHYIHTCVEEQTATFNWGFLFSKRAGFESFLLFSFCLPARSEISTITFRIR